VAGQVLFTSATPGPLELQAGRPPVRQVIRPTGILDPLVEVRPLKGQVDDLIEEIRRCAERKERVLVTTLTKKTAEDLSAYLQNIGMRVKYLHSDITALDRVDILRGLRKADFDCLIGINLLREGLDLPEVALVAVLDADKEGFLRSETSLIQTAGRAARHLEGRVILYADQITDSMKRMIDLTQERRRVQEAYNLANGLTPTKIEKAIGESLSQAEKARDMEEYVVREAGEDYDVVRAIAEMEREMAEAAEAMEFERAALLRDQIYELKTRRKPVQGSRAGGETQADRVPSGQRAAPAAEEETMSEDSAAPGTGPRASANGSSRALAEDIGSGDATTLALVDAESTAAARIVARHEVVLAGVRIAGEVFRTADPALQVDYPRGRRRAGRRRARPLLRVQGPARALLTAERTALNVAQRMTGIATATECLVRIVTDYGTLILDTRKTVPGPAAVGQIRRQACGGGVNHRIGLHDAILIKDNHLAFWKQKNRGTLADAVRCARAAYPGLKIEIEVDTLDQLKRGAARPARLGAAGQHAARDGRRSRGDLRGRLQDRGLRRHHQGKRARIRPRRRHGHLHRGADTFDAGGGSVAGIRVGAMEWGYPCRWLAETESTNDVARDWALAGAPDGAVVVSARQTRGRGRRARVWESPPDTGLYVSFVLRPGWLAKKAPNLAIVAGMAAYRALEAAGVKQLRVKWPNDILAGGKKICGVLVEPRIGGDRIEFAVVGIGINVGQAAGDFPPALRGTATSCRIEGATIAVDRMLERLVESWLVASQTPFDALRAGWLAAGAKEEEPEL
jgi:nicotinate-nucleotide pyrophosphorylase